ncbi:50S ribosomal protein L29 [bacterium]|nr:50S ribosomal protein L29 [bacterium]
MKARDLRNKSTEELHTLLLQQRELLRRLRFDLVAGKVKNIREIREVKKNIARILTIINERRKQQEVTSNNK